MTSLDAAQSASAAAAAAALTVAGAGSWSGGDVTVERFAVNFKPTHRPRQTAE